MATETTLNKIETLKAMLKGENLGFTSEAEWETIVKHIEEHKYLINQNIPWTISWDDAVFSWFENVYTPLKRVADWWEVKNAFPGYTKGQLMFALSSHWYYLNEKNDGTEYGAEEAANHFAGKYGRGIASFISKIKVPA